MDLQWYRDQVIAPWSEDPHRRETLERTVDDLLADPQSRTYAQLDLATLYCVSVPATSVDFSAHEASLTKAFKKLARMPAAPLLARLWDLLDEQLGPELRSPKFWDGVADAAPLTDLPPAPAFPDTGSPIDGAATSDAPTTLAWDDPSEPEATPRDQSASPTLIETNPNDPRPPTPSPDGPPQSSMTGPGSNAPVSSGEQDADPDARVEQLGPAIRIAWVWRDEQAAMAVHWIHQGRPQTRQINHATYRHEGGFRLPADVSDVTLVPIFETDGRHWYGEPARVAYEPDRSLAVEYFVVLQRQLLRPNIRCQLTARAPTNQLHLELDLVVSQLPYLPNSPADGRAIPVSLILSNGIATATVELGALKGAIWVRAFPKTPGVRLVDPPTKQLKG